MTSKGFTENTKNIETPNDIDVTEKPLNPNKISSGRVDINVLKSILEAEQGKELRKKVYYHLDHNFALKKALLMYNYDIHQKAIFLGISLDLVGCYALVRQQVAKNQENYHLTSCIWLCIFPLCL